MNAHKILIVEDERIIANDIKRTLKRLGYGVSDIVSSGEAALQSVVKDPPDLVLMDIKLQGDMDGIETAERLHDEFKVPVVYLTAHAGSEMISRAAHTSTFGYVVKPFSEHALHATIEMSFNKSQIDKKKEPVRKEILKLKNTVKDLLRSNQDLQDFASTASHDLKSPLCNIVSYSAVLEEECPDLGAEEKSYLQVIRKSAARMGSLIGDLLEFAQISHAAKAVHEVDLKELIAKILGDLSAKIREKGAVVNVGELPRVKAEPAQIRHVFQNLIENALKYSGDRAPVVGIDCTFKDHFAEIHVRDNGLGFDEKYSEEIFEPFKRLNKNQEGTGLGLAICRKIVEAHGGKITAKSREGEGSEFIVELPFEKSDFPFMPEGTASKLVGADSLRFPGNLKKTQALGLSPPTPTHTHTHTISSRRAISPSFEK